MDPTQPMDNSELNWTGLPPGWPSYTTRYWLVTRVSVTKLIGGSWTAVRELPFSAVQLSSSAVNELSVRARCPLPPLATLAVGEVGERVWRFIQRIVVAWWRSRHGAGLATQDFGLRQVVHTHVPLSLSSIGLIWYQSLGGDALRLGR